ncbi:MAG: MMPL family transporter [Pseudomonadota bacterium]
MFFTIKDFLEDTTGKISARSQTRAAGVVAVSLLLSTLGLLFVKHNIGINTDTENMLSERLPWRSTYTEFKSHFPFFADTVLIVVEGTTPDVAEDAARELAVNVAKDKQHFHSVFHAAEHEFFRRQQLLYLSEPALFELTDNLSRTQAVLAQLMNEPSGRQLLETLNLALERDAEDQKLERLQVMLANAINKATEGVFEPMSWRRLLASSEHESKGGKDSRVLFTAKPILDYADIMPANAAINALHNISSELEAKYPGLLRIGITGGAALAHDEMSSVIRGSLKAGSFALLMVLACLFIGLRSWVLVFSTLLSLIIGLIFTASFAVAAVGTLNMISIAFAVLYVGLGVDFAIHTCLRYRELIPKNRSSADKFNLINAATRQVGASIALCAMTTSIGFFAFIPTDFKGVAELGLIAGVGMFISLAGITCKYL